MIYEGHDDYIPQEWRCIDISQKCDGVRNCIFGDDEWNCNSGPCTTDNGYFECIDSPSNLYLDDSDSTDNICIRSEDSCIAGDYIVSDCPNQEDISPLTPACPDFQR